MPHDLPKEQRPKPINLLLISGCKVSSHLVGQSKRLPVAYNGTPADIRIMIKHFCIFFTMFQWLVENWEKIYVRSDFTMSKNGLEMIDITLK